jgi:hypothetical protein
MDQAAAQLEALRRIRAVAAGEPIPVIPASEAPEVAVAIGEAFASMREAAAQAAREWCLGYLEGEMARLILASIPAPEDLAE